MNFEEQLQRFEEMGASSNQLYWLKTAIEYGLSEEEIELFLNIAWSGDAMRQILEGFKSGLTIQQINCYTMIKDENPIYSPVQMEQICLGFAQGLSDIEMRELLNNSYSAKEMKKIREKHLKKSSQEKEQKIAGIYKKMEEMIKIFEKEIEIIKKNKEELLLQIKNSKNQIEELEKLLEKEAAEKQEEIVLPNYIKNVFNKPKYLEKKFKRLIEDTRLNERQRNQIRLGYEHGLSIEDILLYASFKLSPKQMEESRIILEIQKQRQEQEENNVQ